MERVTKVDQVRVGLVIIVVAELIGFGLDMMVRLLADRFTQPWMWQLYGVAGFFTTAVALAGLAVLTAGLRDQLLGWLAVGLGSLGALLGLASSATSVAGRWLIVFEVGLYGVTIVLVMLVVSLAARDVFPWLVALALCFAAFGVGSACWSIVRIVLEHRSADASSEVKALRLLLTLVVAGGRVAVPMIAWVGLGRASQQPRAPAW